MYGKNPYQSDNKFLEILRKIRSSLKVWGQLEKEGTAAVGVIYPCVGNVLMGGGGSVSVVRIRILGHVVGDDDYCGGNSYKLTKVYHG